ncbi:CCAAT-box DNA binding protein subunit B, putative [Babesia ovis]|uniref:Condensin complex subunit 2 n=1 Tax=Babesia ovis TaxID=5869 RepID=A0A9W5TCK3_BABOV|nr:CCAAT-box DNA binding protein subunit B, putative [Babesia ovis]
MSTKRRLRSGEIADAAADSGASGPAAKRISRQNDANNAGYTQQLLSLFTDCMSALSTNKICSRNAFEVGIIDHMTDLVHLDGGSDDEDDVIELPSDVRGASGARRLNFTRASKVVESASKIYGYRIEAIYDQTFNVLMNMNSANQADASATTGATTKARGRGRVKVDIASGSRTLAPENEVTLSEIPMDNVVLDPYFLKISSMFDHSGAQGLLLTNLQVTDDLSLDLDGDSLVFAPPRPRSEQTCKVFISPETVKQVAFNGLGDPGKMEILPEALYFRNELQRLQEIKRRKQGGDLIEPELDISQRDLETSTNDLVPIGDMPLDDSSSDTALTQPDMSGVDHIGGDPLPSITDVPDQDILSSVVDALGPVPSTAGPAWMAQEPPSKKPFGALKERLSEIDLVGGSQFSYYTSDVNKPSDHSAARTAGIQGPSADKRSDRTSKAKDGIYTDIATYMQMSTLSQELKSIERVSLTQPTKPAAKQLTGVFTATDYTGSIFKFSDTFLTRLGTLGNRALKFVIDQDWRTTPGETGLPPLLQIHYSNDPEAVYTSILIGENFSWKVDDQIGMLQEEDELWYSYTETADGKRFGIAPDDLDRDIPGTQEPLVNSIENMYEGETFELNLPLSQNMDTMSVMKSIADNNTGSIVPAPVATYVDIFKIKKTLCSVILPPPDFQEAIEDENQLAARRDTPVQTESSCMFQRAITETLGKLNDSEITALTSHIMFVCLLHVCNEHDLLLRQNKALEDFCICAGAPKQHHLGNVSGSL